MLVTPASISPFLLHRTSGLHPSLKWPMGFKGHKPTQHQWWALSQWVSDFRKHQNQLEGLLKQRVSDAVDLEWGPEKFHPKEALILPVWGPYLEIP